MKPAVNCILRGFGNNKGSFAKVVVAQNIIGYRANGNGNVQNADSEQHFGAEQ